MKHLALLSALSIGFLAACETNTNPTVVSYDPATDTADIYIDPDSLNEKNVEQALITASALKAGSVAASKGIQVGTSAVPASSAAQIFANICMNDADFSSLGMVQNPLSKTWYDPKRNLSAQRDLKNKGECSFVFGTRDNDATVIRTMLNSTQPYNSTHKPLTLLDFRPVGKTPDGQNMYHIAIMK